MTTQSALQTQIDNFGARMDKSFDELKLMLGTYENRLREMEKEGAAFRPILESRVDAAWRRLDEHTVEIKDAQKTSATALLVADKLEGIAKWMLGIFTAVIVATVIAIISGRFELIVR